MTKFLAVIAFSAAAALASAAQAQNFPNWPSSLTCKSGDASCARFETFARGQISGTWNTLPPGARAICVAETERVEKSYRLLQDCLANVMQLLLTNQQRKPPSGDVVNLTPKAKEKTPLPVPQAGPTTQPEPAPMAAPVTPLPVPQAGPATPPEPVAETAPQVMPASPAEPASPPQTQ